MINFAKKNKKTLNLFPRFYSPILRRWNPKYSLINLLKVDIQSIISLFELEKRHEQKLINEKIKKKTKL